MNFDEFVDPALKPLFPPEPKLRILDRLLLAVVRRRLARFRMAHDHADLFGDGLADALAAEIKRRNAEIKDWQVAMAELLRAEAAQKFFQRLGSEDNRHQSVQ